MKKFLSIIAIATMLLASSTTAQAQFEHRSSSIYPGHTAIVVSQQRLFELCRDNVRRGDDYFRRGDFRLAQREYEDARRYNDDCYDHKFISPRELDRKIDDCVYAQNHRGMTRHEEMRREDDRVAAAIAGAIITTAINSQARAAQATPAKAVPAPAPATNDELVHYNKNGLSYDTNSTCTNITRIERNGNEITLHFEFLYMKDNFGISVNEGCYIKDHATGRKIAPNSLQGINYKTNGKIMVTAGDCYDFSITFPAPSEGCHSIDFIEPGQNGWKFYHIAI